MGILTDIKTMLGLREIDAFDSELIIYINSAFSVLQQRKVGPSPQIEINETTDWSVWDEWSVNIKMIREYAFLSVKIIFDSQSMTGTNLEAHKNRKAELEWRLQVNSESDK
jgi:hypothetical protein